MQWFESPWCHQVCTYDVMGALNNAQNHYKRNGFGSLAFHQFAPMPSAQNHYKTNGFALGPIADAQSLLNTMISDLLADLIFAHVKYIDKHDGSQCVCFKPLQIPCLWMSRDPWSHLQHENHYETRGFRSGVFNKPQNHCKTNGCIRVCSVCLQRTYINIVF